MRDSFGEHESQPGQLTLNEAVPGWVRDELRRMGYTLDFDRLHLGPDQRHLLRPRARHHLGRLQQPRRGLRHRLVKDVFPRRRLTYLTRGN